MIREGTTCRVSTLDVWGLGLAIGVLTADLLDRTMFSTLIPIYVRAAALIPVCRASLIIVVAFFITVIWHRAYIRWWCYNALVSGACDEAIMRFLEYMLHSLYLTGEIDKNALIAGGVRIGLDEHMVYYVLNELMREGAIRLCSEPCRRV